MKYNYREAMKSDIREYLDWYEDIDGNMADELYEEMWIADSITGNASGSYTFNRWQAEEYVKDNLPLCIEAMEEFGCSAEEFGKKVYNEEWEYLDVTIRCYLLGECLNDVLGEMSEEILGF